MASNGMLCCQPFQNGFILCAGPPLAHEGEIGGNLKAVSGHFGVTSGKQHVVAYVSILSTAAT